MIVNKLQEWSRQQSFNKYFAMDVRFQGTGLHYHSIVNSVKLIYITQRKSHLHRAITCTDIEDLGKCESVTAAVKRRVFSVSQCKEMML